MMPAQSAERLANIKVVGVGGGGGNAIRRMREAGVKGVELIAVNTDSQALEGIEADRRIHIGDKSTKGLGAGGHPSVGLKAAEESSDQIYEALKGADMVFITAGLGGGTGTGAAPIIAQLAREVGALTVAVVTKPFAFEGAKRRLHAEEGIVALREKVDTLIVIPNDRLITVVAKTTTMAEAMRVADEVLRQGIQGITELITMPASINLDFNDVRTIMQQAGSALISIGEGKGDERAADAAKAAISSPLLEVSINGAKGIIYSVVGGTDTTLAEITEAGEIISKVADPDAHIIFGWAIDPAMEGTIKITVVATGFDGKVSARQQSAGTRGARAIGGAARLASPVLPEVEDEDEGDVPDFLRERPALSQFRRVEYKAG